MSGIDERTEERERRLIEAMEGARRLARIEDYVFDKAQEAFWDLRDGTMHSERAVDASIPLEYWRAVPGEKKDKLIPPSKDILRVENDQFVESSTWWPGMPQLIRDWFISAEGFFPAEGRRSYNQYRPPPPLVEGGDAEAAEPWIEHVKRVWPIPSEHEFFFDYFAHMIQRPEEKCNAALVLSGAQGIGKDAALEPVKAAAGTWNVRGIDPDELFSPYRPWLQTLMLVVDEVRPTKDEFHASSMYNILKPMIVAPPNTLPLNDKYAKLRYVINVMRVVITTNDWLAMYIPPEDRRMFIMHSPLPARWHLAAEDPEYFTRLFAWFAAGGSANVAAWLRRRDLSRFDPKAQVERTAGWEAVAETWAEPEDAVTDALDRLGHPLALFGAELVADSFDGKEELAGALKSPRKIGHRMQRAGYVMVSPPGGGRWTFRCEGHVFRARLAFVRSDAALGPAERLAAIEERGKAAAIRMAAAAGSTIKVAGKSF